ncbi:MAG TPA: hypothetical protein VIT21_11295 [Chthoniobacterales bacterium]
MNRLTITLDDDLYAMARAHALATKTSISKAISDLLRRKVSTHPGGAAAQKSDPDSYFDPELGILVSRADRPFTEADIQRAMDDDDLRIAEAAGWVSPTDSPS